MSHTIFTTGKFNWGRYKRVDGELVPIEDDEWAKKQWTEETTVLDPLWARVFKENK